MNVNPAPGPPVAKLGPPAPAPKPSPPAAPNTNSSVNAPTTYNPTGPTSGPLGQDPGYEAALNSQHRNDAAAAALLNQLTQSANYGYNGAGNPYSTLALLHQQDVNNTRAYMNSLAARGILASGETGYQQQQEAKNYGLALYNAQRALAAQLLGYKQNYLNTLNTDQGSVDSALQAAYANYVANPSAYGNWNNGTLPGGLPGWVPITSPYQDPLTGGGIRDLVR